MELTTTNSLGLDDLSVGMNVCVGRSSATNKTYLWGENHDGNIAKKVEGDVASPHLFSHASDLVYAGWNSVTLLHKGDGIMSCYGAHAPNSTVPREDVRDIVQIVSTAFQTAFLKRDGTISFQNDRQDIEFEHIEIPAKIRKMARGWGHFLLLDDMGQLWVVGANKHGQCGVGNTNHIVKYEKLCFVWNCNGMLGVLIFFVVIGCCYTLIYFLTPLKPQSFDFSFSFLNTER